MEYVSVVQLPAVEGLVLPKWFVEDVAVQRWLGKYGSAATRRGFAFYVLKYLEWLRGVKGVVLSPSGLLEANLRNVYGSGPIEVWRKREHTDWLQEFVGFNGPLRFLSNSYRRTAATAVRSLYRRNDAPLFGDFQVPFNAQEEKLTQQISMADVRRYVSILPLRSKTISVCLLQSGMRISEFLQVKWRMVQRSVEKNESPVRIMLRNDRGREYFTFLGNDGIAALKLYLNYRKSLVRRSIQPEEYIFINDFGSSKYRTDRPLLKDYVERQIVRAVTAKGLAQKKSGLKWRCEFHPHALRHLFKTECAHAGIHPMVSEFWMGHDKGVEYVYNHQHELHVDDFVKMYRKVEPYLSLNPQASEEHEEIVTLRERMAKMEQNQEKLLTMIQDSVTQGKKQIESIR